MAIDPIKFNSAGTDYLRNDKPEEKTAGESIKDVKPQGKEEKNYSAEDVLNFMAQSSYVPAPKVKTVNVADYVNEEQAARISDFVRDYEEQITKGMSAISAEFPKIDENSKMALAVEYFNNQNL